MHYITALTQRIGQAVLNKDFTNAYRSISYIYELRHFGDIAKLNNINICIVNFTTFGKNIFTIPNPWTDFNAIYLFSYKLRPKSIRTPDCNLNRCGTPIQTLCLGAVIGLAWQCLVLKYSLLANTM